LLNFRIKEEIWESEILPNWPKYYDTCMIFCPLNPKELKITYNVPKLDKNGKIEEGEIKQRVKKMKFSDLIMHGIPLKIRRVVYPILLGCKIPNM
jgi:hypothetical protein